MPDALFHAESATLDFDGWQAGLDEGSRGAINFQLSIAPDREAEKRRLANSLFLSASTGLDLPTVGDNYEKVRDGWAVQQGYNAPDLADDNAFAATVKTRMTAARDERGVAEDLARQARRSVLWDRSGLPIGAAPQSGAWTKANEATPGYHVAKRGEYEAAWGEIVGQERARFAPVAADLDAAWDEVYQPAKGSEPLPGDVWATATRLASLPEAKLNLVLAGLKERGEMLPEAEQGPFFERLTQSFTRQVNALAQSTLLEAPRSVAAQLVSEGGQIGEMLGVEGAQAEGFNQAADLRRPARIARRLANLRAEKVDNIESDSLLGKVALGAAGSVPGVIVAAAVSPWALLPQFTADAQSELNTTFEAQGMDPEAADAAAGAIAPVAGTLMAAAEKLTFGFAKGPTAALQRKISTILAGSAPVTRFGAGLVVETGEQFAQEIIQDSTPVIVAEIANTIGVRVPDQAVMARIMQAASPETLGVSIMFALGGGGAMPQVEQTRDLQSLGFTPEAVETVLAATSEAERQTAFEVGLATATPPAPAPGAPAPAAAAGAAAADANAAAGLAEIVRDRDGWHLVHEDGNRTTVDSAAAALALRDRLEQVNTAEEAEAMVRIADNWAETDDRARQRFTGVAVLAGPDGVATQRPGQNPRMAPMDEASAQNLQAEMDRAAALEGGEAPMQRLVLGSNSIEWRAQVADDTRRLVNVLDTKQNIGGTVLTQLHERVESVWRAGIETGAISMAETMRALRALELGINANLLGEDPSETEVRETLSEAVIANELGLRRDGSRIAPGAISKGIKAAIEAATDPATRTALGKVRAFMKAVGQHFRQVFKMAAAIKKARRDGKLGQGDDFTAFADKLLGIDTQKSHERAAATAWADENLSPTTSVVAATPAAEALTPAPVAAAPAGAPTTVGDLAAMKTKAKRNVDLAAFKARVKEALAQPEPEAPAPEEINDSPDAYSLAESEKMLQGFFDFTAVPAAKAPAAVKSARAAGIALRKPTAAEEKANREYAQKADAAEKAWAGMLGGAKEFQPEALAMIEKGPVSSILHDYVSRKIPSWDVRGAKIETAADLAALLYSIRSPYLETLKLALVDENGVVISSRVAGVGALGEVSGNVREWMGHLQEMVAENPGVKPRGYYISHNHPSGNPLPSAGDKGVTEQAAAVSFAAGLPLLDHVITNGGRYYSFSEDSQQLGQQYLERGTAARGERMTGPRGKAQEIAPLSIPGFNVREPWEVASRAALPFAADPMQLGAISKRIQTSDPDHAHIVYLTTKMTVTAVERVTLDNIEQVVARGSTREAAYAIAISLPQLTAEAMQGGKAGDIMTNTILATRKLRALGIKTMDVVSFTPEWSVWSAKERNLLEEGAEYGATAAEPAAGETYSLSSGPARLAPGFPEPVPVMPPGDWKDKGKRDAWRQALVDFKANALKWEAEQPPGKMLVFKTAYDDWRTTLVTPDPGEPGSWRLTHFDVTQPDGPMPLAHRTHPTRRDVVVEILENYNTARAVEGETFSLSAATGLERLANQIANRPATPVAKARIWQSLAKELAGMARSVLLNDDNTAIVGIAEARQAAKVRKAELLEKYTNEALEAGAGEAIAQSDLGTMAGNPFISWLTEGTTGLNMRGKLMSVGRAVASGKYDPDQGHGDYDDMPPMPAVLMRGTMLPDRVARDAHAAGWLTEDSVNELWDLLGKELASVETWKQRVRAAEGKLIDARKRAADEARVFEEQQIAKARAMKSASADLDAKRALLILDRMLMALPAEVRAKVGGFTRVADLKSNDARFKYFASKVAEMDRVLERHLRVEYQKEIIETMRRGRPRTAAGERDKSKIGVDGHAWLAEAERIMGLSEHALQSEETAVAALAAAAAIDEPTLRHYAKLFTFATDEAGARQAIEQHENLLNLFGGLMHRNTSADGQDLGPRRTAGEAYAALEAATDAVTTGRMAYFLEVQRKREQRASRRNTAMVDVGSTGSLAEKQRAKEGEHGFARWWKEYADSHFSFEGFMSSLFGEQSTTHAWADDTSLTSDLAYRDSMRAREDNLGGFLRSLWPRTGRKDRLKRIEALATPRDVAGAPTPSSSRMGELDAVHFTMLWMDEDTASKEWLELHGLGAKAQTALEAFLSDEAKAIRRWLVEGYDRQYEEINAVHRRLYGVNMARVRNYAPRLVDHGGNSNDMSLDPLAAGRQLMAGFTKRRRIDTKSPPTQVDALTAYWQNAHAVEYWKAWVETTADFRAVFSHFSTHAAVMARHGKGTAAALNEWLEILAMNGVKQANGQGALRRWTTAMADSALVAKLGVLGKQLAAGYASASQLGLPEYMGALSRIATGQTALSLSDMFNADPVQRRMGRVDAEVRLATRGRGMTPAEAQFNKWLKLVGTDLNALDNAQLWLRQRIGWTDAAFTSISALAAWDVAHREALAAGAVDVEARAMAWRATEKVVADSAQPETARDKSLSEQRMGVVGRLLMPFQSANRQALGMFILAARQGRTKDAVQMAVLHWMVTGFVAQTVGSIMRSALSGEDVEEIWEWEDYARAMLIGPLTGARYLGMAIEAVAPLFGGFERRQAAVPMAEGIRLMRKAVTGDFDFKAIMDSINGVGLLIGGRASWLSIAVNVAKQGAGVADTLTWSDAEADEKASKVDKEEIAAVAKARKETKAELRGEPTDEEIEAAKAGKRERERAKANAIRAAKERGEL